ncbi:hypothetical protein [Halorubrum kocurii]|uniref:Uncharacterized protein n=1 Tax=Halorubrum kocurii JCM 14978 TaxID=1230456 RepID=M0PDE8_9EURY|nr:hypothetical protein [Halorubrum kocurii]EMA67903.1 hypothetical protein C468_02861 [Halorubrum kocurii JCM 14978]
MLDSDELPCGTVDDASKRKFGSLLVIGQGVLTALAPGISERLTRKMLSKNFENADQLEAKPAYRRQVRALGIGTAAAGIAGYAMEVASEGDAADGETDDDAGDDEATA